MTRTTPNRLLIVGALHALVLGTFAWGLGWVDRLPAFRTPSHRASVESAPRRPRAATFSMNVQELFPPDPLPWIHHFENDDRPPACWLMNEGVYSVENRGGDRVLVKAAGHSNPSATDPMETCLFGGFDLFDCFEIQACTVQADVCVEAASRSPADVGIITEGCVLELQGANQQLVVRSRLSPEINLTSRNFSWVADRWYTLKLRAMRDATRIVLRAKAWPRREPEPPRWLLDATVDPPERPGCPGVAGRNAAARILFDNIQVVAN